MKLFETMNTKHLTYPTVVNITEPTAQSIKGRYFLGQTGRLEVGRSTQAYGALSNPPYSERNLYLEVFTVSNLSSEPMSAGVWFNATPPGTPINSNRVTNANMAISPVPEPRGQIIYTDDLSASAPIGGVEAFIRVISPEATLADEKEGRYIIGPGKVLLISLSSAARCNAEAVIALGWWEVPICPHETTKNGGRL